MIKNKSGEPIIVNGDEYFPYTHFYDYLPRINGMPVITSYPNKRYFSHFIRDRYNRKVPVYKIHQAPKRCHFRKLINYPFRKLGAPLVALRGNYGTGKSNMETMILALLAARRIRILMFVDRRMECRHLSKIGYFDKNDVFIPLQMDIWIPKGYEFKSGTPLWMHRENVHKKEFTDIDQIIDSMKPYTISVIYDELFDDESRIKLWIDLMTRLAEVSDTKKHYLFATHELSRLFPEASAKNKYHLVREAADVALNLRKDRIGFVACYHLSGEVQFQHTQKFGIIFYTQPVNKRTELPVEKAAKGFGLGDVNISVSGYWMQHHFTEFPEMEDVWRMIPQRYKINYPELKRVGNEKVSKNSFLDMITNDPRNVRIWNYRQQGLSIPKIASQTDINIKQTRVGVLVKQLEACYNDNY